jgi:N-acetylneuraminic acid mutarotase
LVFHENQIIVIGGVDENQTPIAAVDCFNIDKETWEQLAPLPVGVTGPYITKIDSRIYCLGGTDKKDVNQSLYYDLDLSEWKDLPPLNKERYACGGYVHDKKIYVVGGRKFKDPIQSVEVLDLETHQWTELASMTSIRVFYNIMGNGDFIYVVGGFVPMVGLSKIVERYDIKKNEWTRLKDLRVPQSDGSIGVVGGRVVFTAGLGMTLNADPKSPPCPLNYTYAITNGSDTFERIPNMKTKRASTATCLFDGKMAVVCGAGNGGPQTVIEILSYVDKKD